jgi:hypothetical protein
MPAVRLCTVCDGIARKASVMRRPMLLWLEAACLSVSARTASLKYCKSRTFRFAESAVRPPQNDEHIPEHSFQNGK